jgi:uncharacterized protein
MSRIVLDTNVIVSALLQPVGPPAQIFVLALGGPLQLYVSANLYAEYEEVISRPRFKRSEEIIASALRAIREKGFWVRPTTRLHLCADPDDNMFLECAQAARAEYLVAGNLKHFPPTWESTRIVTPRHLLDVVLGKNNKERV